MALSGSFTGTTSSDKIIPVIRWSATQDTNANKSTVTATLYYYRTNGYTTSGDWTGTLTIDGSTISKSGVWAYIRQTEYEIISYTVTVPHNIDGSKTLTISATGRVPGTTLESTNISATITLDQINRTSSISCNNGTLSEPQTLTIKKVVSEFTHDIFYSCGTTSGTVCDETGSTSISWTPPLELASQNTTGTSVSVTFTITTYHDGNTVGQQTKTVAYSMPDFVKPSCSVSIVDMNNHALQIGAYVQNQSRFKIITTPVPSYGAEIITTTVTADGVTYYGNSVESNVVRSSGNLTITVTVKDTRNRTGTKSLTVNVLEYIPPQITGLTVHRCNAEGVANAHGAYGLVTFNSKITPLNDKNAANYMLEYKKTTETAYTAMDMTAYGGIFVLDKETELFAANSGASYDVKFTVTDTFGSVSKITVLSTGFAIMHWLASGLGMAIGKVAELTNVFEISWKTKFSGGILHPVLEKNVDLDEVLTPNTYSCMDASSANYKNSPFSTGAFTLEVIGAGTEGELIQRATKAVKGDHAQCSRVYYNASWSEWKNVLEILKQELNTKIETAQTQLNSIAGKIYADGFVFVEFGSLPNSSSHGVDIVFPEAVSDFWLDNGWAYLQAANMRFPLPYVNDATTANISVYLEGQKIFVSTNTDRSNMNGFFIIAYKKQKREEETV